MRLSMTICIKCERVFAEPAMAHCKMCAQRAKRANEQG